MTDICPHCGYDLKNDEIIELDGFTIDPRGLVTYNNVEIQLSNSEIGMLHAIAKAKGRWLASNIIGERISDSESRHIANVCAFRIRSKFKNADVNCPIESRKGNRNGFGGYRWNAQS